MASVEEKVTSRKRKRDPASLTGPYTLKPLLEEIPLSADGESSSIKITCVEYWDGNLYIGTSAAEVLHFVSIPGDPADSSARPTFILASRLDPSPAASTESQKGVQQIRLLPRVGKACIRCNGVLTFHTLPELSPAYGNTKISNCVWIGGRDLDLGPNEGGDGDVIMVCVKSRIRMVRLGDDATPKLVRNIEFPGCLNSVQRGRYACVAGAISYSLLDVENQQKIPLFPISSLEGPPETVSDEKSALSSQRTDQLPSRNSSLADPRHGEHDHGGHARSTSLGAFVGGLGRKQPRVRSGSPEPSLLDTPSGAGSRSPAASSPVRSATRAQSPAPKPEVPDKPLPPNPSEQASALAAPLAEPPMTREPLKPLICSPISTEFLLVTGTTPSEPGVGIFVNLDGDVVRGTLEFSRYPDTVVIDDGAPDVGQGLGSSPADMDGYVLATVIDRDDKSSGTGIEIQRWDAAGEDKMWLALPTESDEDNTEVDTPSQQHRLGLGVVQSANEIHFPEVGQKLRSRRLQLSTRTEDREEEEEEDSLTATDSVRNEQEDKFAERLGHTASRIVVWANSTLSWAVRNPILLRLEASINQLLDQSLETSLDQAKLIQILKDVRAREAKTETDFLSIEYVRQKISIILFANLATNRYDVHPHINEQLFVESGVDPRIILSMVPLLHPDIVEGPKGIWIHAGLVDLIEQRFSNAMVNLDPDEVLSRPEEYDVLNLVKRYLSVWRQRKGFGSVADEVQVSSTVDAALLHVLLHQDQQSLLGYGNASSVRADLYAVVDHGVSCFERAIELLEEHRRLYVLSRLYQSRKMGGRVLNTWQRILEGERDDGGELVDGENEVRKYLVKIKDVKLFEEYGTWLAKRNPLLGVQVFTDDHSRVKLPPNQVVQLLRLTAPDAVKVYLEHLVFGKKNIQYANELISYYLDNVLQVLESSEEARGLLAETYATYKALRPPKPTYRQFITENAISAAWWHDRLRLLELLGGTHGAGFSYNVSRVLERIEPFESSLVPESIILDGRQGRHEQALRLLTHGLGDYHTAINYCLLGGSSIFHPAEATDVDAERPAPPTRDEQSALFRHLFDEFLRIQDTSDRLERTSELLARYGTWFDVAEVLARIPDSWSVELVSAFLVGAFRRMVQDKSETMIVKSLSGSHNLRITAELVEKCEARGPIVEQVES